MNDSNKIEVLYRCRLCNQRFVSIIMPYGEWAIKMTDNHEYHFPEHIWHQCEDTHVPRGHACLIGFREV